MKFSRSILAFCLFGSSLAFVVQHQSTRSVTPSLAFSSRQDEESDTAPNGGGNGGETSGLSNKPNAAGDRTDQGDSRSGNNKNVWDTLETVTIQGGSLKTWSFSNYNNIKRRVDERTGFDASRPSSDVEKDD